jgi:DedD protein
MEEKYDNLDLIIQSKKSSGLKKLLLTAAILLLVLIFIILITKSLIQSDNKTQSSIMLPPKPVAYARTHSREPLFEQVPIEEEVPAEKKIEQVIDKLKKNVPIPQKSTPKREVVTEAAPAEVSVESIKKEKRKKTIVSSPKKQPLKPKPVPAAAVGNYFIQVGAFFRYSPNKKFLDSIEKAGLRYVIAEGMKNGTPYKKVMVGPYPSRAAAQKDLERVKKHINQHAYITKKR